MSKEMTKNENSTVRGFEPLDKGYMTDSLAVALLSLLVAPAQTYSSPSSLGTDTDRIFIVVNMF